MSTIKYVTEESLQTILTKLKEWLPFKKSSEGVVEMEGEIHMGEKVYIKTDPNKEVLLQDIVGATTLDPPGSIEKETIDNIIEQYN